MRNIWIRGIPDVEVSGNDVSALVLELQAVRSSIDWVGATVEFGLEEPNTVVGAVRDDPDGPAPWRTYAQTLALVLVASRVRPGWMWSVDDDESALSNALRAYTPMWMKGGRVVRRRAGAVSEALPAPDLHGALLAELEFGLGADLQAFGLTPVPGCRSRLEQKQTKAARRLGADAPGVAVEGPLGPRPSESDVGLDWAALAVLPSGVYAPTDLQGRVHLHNATDRLLSEVELIFVARGAEGRVLDRAQESMDLVGPGEARELKVENALHVRSDRVAGIDVWVTVHEDEYIRGESTVAWEEA